jgi:uncharacterized protein YqeY
MTYIIERIREDLKTAMRAKDTTALNTLRGIISARTNELVAKGRTPQEELSEEEMTAVIRRLAKQRRESAEQYRAAHREDLAVVEDAELALISHYLPTPLSRNELEAIVQEEASAFEVIEPKQRGQLIGAIMKRTGGNVEQEMLQDILKTYFN